MTFTKGDWVMTPLGVGTVQHQIMQGPTYTDAAAVSVLLDSRIYDTVYNGTMFPADKVTKIPNCEDGTCTKCEICSDGYKDFVAAKMAGELD